MKLTPTATVEQWLGLSTGAIADAKPHAVILDFSEPYELKACDKVVVVPIESSTSYIVMGISDGSVPVQFTHHLKWICSDRCITAAPPTVAD